MVSHIGNFRNLFGLNGTTESGERERQTDKRLGNFTAVNPDFEQKQQTFFKSRFQSKVKNVCKRNIWNQRTH